MSESVITQQEADDLIAMEKIRINDESWDFPEKGGKISAPLVSLDKRENFLLDIARSHINLVKNTYQNRARQAIILVRLDIGGATHTNPDGEEIKCPHLHVYREAYGDKWALSLPPKYFKNTDNLDTLLTDFMRYCNITKPPVFQGRLFI